jgi:hypothetical protein
LFAAGNFQVIMSSWAARATISDFAVTLAAGGITSQGQLGHTGHNNAAAKEKVA